MDVAILAVVVVGALNVVFFAPQPRPKVDLTIFAFPVIRGVPDMLVVSRPRVEVAVTAITISHLLNSSTEYF